MKESVPEDPQWMAFRRSLEKAIGVPLAQHKDAQMTRRLASVMTRRSIDGWPAFEKAIAADQKLLEDVRDTLTINVSEFWRQPERCVERQKEWIPRLLAGRKQLKFWSAGCSIGCEPYSLAMILNEIDPTGAHSIVATDVDVPILNRAREGKGYLASEVRSVPAPLVKKYFIEEPAGTFRVTEELKRRITFRRQDLPSDPYPQDSDLIPCRNVVIYFTDEAKTHIYNGFAKAWRPGGLLFIGGSEMIMRSRDIGFRSAGTNLYLRAA